MQILTHMLYIHQKGLSILFRYVLCSKCRESWAGVDYLQEGTNISIHGDMSTQIAHRWWVLSALDYTPYCTILLCALAGWYSQSCATWVTICKVASPHAQGSLKCRNIREDFVAEARMSIANFAVAYLRHMHWYWQVLRSTSGRLPFWSVRWRLGKTSCST